MRNDSKIDISEKVISLIKNGQVKMKPKWYFVLGSFAMIVGITGLTVLSLFFVSLISFSIRTHGPMGAIRYNQLLATFPWSAVIFTIIGIGLGIWLLKKYEFSYKKNFFLIAVGIILAIFFAGWLIDYTGLDTMWIHKGPMKEFYQRHDGGCTTKGYNCRINN
jgi:hypothetical protein